MYKIAVLSSSGGTNFQSIIDAIRDRRIEGVDLAALITDKINCGAVDKAEAADIPAFFIDPEIYKTREAFDAEVMKVLERNGIDLVVLGGYMRIVGPEMVKAYKNRIINIHPSLLPKYPGMDLKVHGAVLKNKEKESGMTIHFIDEGVDTGPIILQKTVEISPKETPFSLKAKVQELEKEWYPKVIEMFAKGEIKIPA